MIKNYFSILLRNLWRNKIFSTINILGLSLGLSVCILILLYTADETSYDAFHVQKNNLYQLTCKIVEKDGSSKLYGLSGPKHGPTFKTNIPEIKEATRVNETDMVIKKGTETFEEKITWVDDNFFNVFSFNLLKGNPKNVLSDPYSMVLTEEMAEKYFGTRDVIGKTLELEAGEKFESYTITGLVKKAPQNSSIKYKILASFNQQDKNRKYDGWFFIAYPTFLLLNSNVNLASLSKKMNQVYEKSANVAEARKKGIDFSFEWGVQPMLAMHLNKEVEASLDQSDPLYSYILSAIALFILLIACINFINLTVAQSLKRSKEIGVRKVIGGSRKQLFLQFIGESFLVCFIAFVSGIFLSMLILPFFNEVTNKELELNFLFNLKSFSALLLLFIFTSFMAGFYPAFVLSKFRPIETLSNKLRFGGTGYFSKGLIILQFVLATVLIISTLFMYKQFNYLTTKELGYDYKNLLSITTSRDEDKKLQSVFKDEFSKVAGVTSLAKCMNGSWVTKSKANGREIDVKYESIDEDYLSTLGLKLTEGRNFSKDFPGDSTTSVLVNESFVKEVGWKGSALGKTVDYLNGNDTKLKIVGVVKNYHYESLKQPIKPQLFSMQPELPFGRFVLKINEQNVTKTKTALETIYHKLIPFHPFIYSFKSDDLLKSYEEESKWKSIIAFAAAFTIFISCIGLLGLIMLSIQKQTKEIGIRKILGAGILRLSVSITKNFITLIIIAFIIATPLAWMAVNKWLESFAFHTEVNLVIFCVALFLILFLAIITLGFQTLKAATSNPVNSLRTE